MLFISLVLLIISGVLMVATACVGIPLSAPEVENRPVKEMLSSKTLSNGGFTKYGIGIHLGINGHYHSKLTVSTDCEGHGDITVLLTNQIKTVTAYEEIERSLSNGPGINSMYSIGKFAYDVLVSVETVGTTTFYYEVTLTSTEKGNNRHVVCNETVLISNETDHIISCLSSDSGYYDVSYTVPANLTGSVTGRVTYDQVNVRDYRNWTESDSNSCAIDSNGKSCSISVPFTHSADQLVLIISSIDECLFTLRSEESNELIYLSVLLPEIVLFVIAILCAIIIFVLLLMRYRLFKEEIDVPHGQDATN